MKSNALTSYPFTAYCAMVVMKIRQTVLSISLNFLDASNPFILGIAISIKMRSKPPLYSSIKFNPFEKKTGSKEMFFSLA